MKKSRSLSVMLGIALLTLPAALQAEERAWIKVGENPDGTYRCLPHVNCHPLYNECCGGNAEM